MDIQDALDRVELVGIEAVVMEMRVSPHLPHQRNAATAALLQPGISGFLQLKMKDLIIIRVPLHQHDQVLSL